MCGPGRCRDRRRRSAPRRGVGVVGLIGWVWIAPFSVLGTANLALAYALVAVSLVVLTGWVGQISLAQASFVGIGAFGTGVVVARFTCPFPLTLPIAGTGAGRPPPASAWSPCGCVACTWPWPR